jgi:LysM repeat protein
MQATSEETVHRLRRRIRIERSFFAAAAAAATATWLYPIMIPGAWAVYVEDRPVVALKGREEAEAALEQLKQEHAEAGAPVTFVQNVRIGTADPKKVPVTEPEAAKEALESVVKLRAERAVIYIDGVAAVALPDEEQARKALARVKADLAGDPDSLVKAPEFRETVEIVSEAADQDFWADVETTVRLLKGESGEEPKSYRVAAGDTSWGIAEKNNVTMDDLRRLNPQADLGDLQVGQSLTVAGGKEEPVVTVLSEGKRTSVRPISYGTVIRRNPKVFVGKRFLKQPGIPGRERVTYRIRYENGRPVEREVLDRTVLSFPRDKIVVLGAKPRG